MRESGEVGVVDGECLGVEKKAWFGLARRESSPSRVRICGRSQKSSHIREKVGGWDSGRSRALESKLRVFGRKRNKRRSLSEDHGLANITLGPVHSKKGEG